ncbi:MAG: YeeE/YedE family protein [Gammaproteobacteria bacterium]|nr:YeeE/YedE family protein [Gammaproteobacteria bacterium]
MKFGREIAGLAVGTVFGLGLAVSQMANPEKVLAFLTVVGDWDPSLLFVMGGATVVAFIGYRWIMGNTPLFAERQFLPGNSQIDARLIGGAAIFGIGWGLAGYCPGPALTGLGSGSMEPFIFVAAMIAGSLVARIAPG